MKSKQRVADHGEVFTAEREVNAMLDLVKQETDRIDSRFLEPACGTGNFLTEILIRKLAIVEKPSILIPSPNVAEDHQYHNAKAISDLDAAICLVEEEADLLFKNKLDMLIKDEEYRRVLSSNISKLASPDASIKIVDKIKNHLSYE